ncbi:hypothetical protein PHPALM_30118 [Phytophthora palmivora]|uniref:Uncharacterized protein n=1 Tax=Phytophthora palmivora TaxID=4796 RepID=A0A2P4X5X6_9STRA|nr:hypothetical protein PHPALM_30118 [Phytophthora palmivora]
MLYSDVFRVVTGFNILEKKGNHLKYLTSMFIGKSTDLLRPLHLELWYLNLTSKRGVRLTKSTKKTQTRVWCLGNSEAVVSF